MLHWIVDTVDSLTPRPVKQLLKRVSPGIEDRIYRQVQHWTTDEVRQVRIRRGPLSGRPFFCNMRRERDYYAGLWEVDLVAFLESRLQPGDVFYDIGVHNGYFGLIAAQCVGPSGRVLGFEPNPANRTIINRNIALNPDLAPLINLHPFAVSDASGKMRFVAAGDSATGHLQHEAGSHPGGYEVDVVSVDEFVALGAPPPQVVKMDIEGGERWALPGMRQTIERHRPLIVVEIHDADAWNALRQVVAQYDYKLSNLSGEEIAQDNSYASRDQFVAQPR